MSNESPAQKLNRARDIVGWYTLAAAASGAVPVPASSVAIVANNGFMIAHVNAAMGSTVTWQGVVASLGMAGTLNIAGRTVFIEGAKALSWGTGSFWALVGLSALGATTAGLQTCVIGLIAIEMAKNGGSPVDHETTGDIVATAKASFVDFVAEMKQKGIRDPGPPSRESQAAVDATTTEP